MSEGFIKRLVVTPLGRIVVYRYQKPDFYNKCVLANNFFQSTYAADTLRACQDLARADRGSEGQLSAGRPHPRHQRTHLSLHLVKRGPPFRLRQVWLY